MIPISSLNLTQKQNKNTLVPHFGSYSHSSNEKIISEVH